MFHDLAYYDGGHRIATSLDNNVFNVDEHLSRLDQMGNLRQNVRYYDAAACVGDSRQELARADIENSALVRATKRHWWHRTRQLLGYNGLFVVNPAATRMYITMDEGDRGVGSSTRKKHSSMLAGGAVCTAGGFTTDAAGFMTSIDSSSGHYTPSAASLNRFLMYLADTPGARLPAQRLDTTRLASIGYLCSGRNHGEFLKVEITWAEWAAMEPRLRLGANVTCNPGGDVTKELRFTAVAAGNTVARGAPAAPGCFASCFFCCFRKDIEDG